MCRIADTVKLQRKNSLEHWVRKAMEMRSETGALLEGDGGSDEMAAKSKAPQKGGMGSSTGAVACSPSALPQPPCRVSHRDLRPTSTRSRAGGATRTLTPPFFFFTMACTL